MSNFMLFYREKELELQNEIIELKKMKFDTKEFEDRLAVLNSRFNDYNKGYGNTDVQVIQKAEFRVLSSLSDLENDIQKAFLYFSMCQSAKNVENKFTDKNNQSENQLNIYSRELLSIASALNKMQHTNYEYLKFVQSKIYTTIYNLIKIEFRLFDRSNTLERYLLEKNNQNYLIELMNKDYFELTSQNQESNLKENVVNPDGSLNKDSLRELAFNDRIFKNQVINELDELDEKTTELQKEYESDLRRTNDSKDNLNSAKHNKKHAVKELIRDGWSPLLSATVIATIIALPWKNLLDSTQVRDISYMTTIEEYDTINGSQTIKEYTNNEEGTTVITDYFAVKPGKSDRFFKSANIYDNKETDPSKLVDLNIDDYKVSSGNTTNSDSFKRSKDDFRLIKIVTDVDENDVKSEFSAFYYVLLCLLSNIAGILAWMFTVEFFLSGCFGLGFFEKIPDTLTDIEYLFNTLKEKTEATNEYYKYKELSDKVENQLNTLKLQYKELYDKYNSILPEKKKLERK